MSRPRSGLSASQTAAFQLLAIAYLFEVINDCIAFPAAEGFIEPIATKFWMRQYSVVTAKGNV